MWHWKPASTHPLTSFRGERRDWPILTLNHPTVLCRVLATNIPTLPRAQLMLIIDSGRRGNSRTISYERQQRKPIVSDNSEILSKRTWNHLCYIRIVGFDKALNNHLTHKGRILVISIVVLIETNQQRPTFLLPRYPLVHWTFLDIS